MDFLLAKYYFEEKDEREGKTLEDTTRNEGSLLANKRGKEEMDRGMRTKMGRL